MSSSALVQTSSSSTPVVRSNASQLESTPSGTVSVSQQDTNKNIQSSAQKQTAISTPTQAQPQPPTSRSTPRPGTPGQWEHPQMQEIIRRQRRTTFDQTNATRLIRSTGALLAVVFGPGLFAEWFVPKALVKAVPPELMWLSYPIQLWLLANMLAAVMPLLRKKDPIEDIPLTPRQRQLLDLPPMTRSATPQEQAAWVTPPRYQRNTTPSSMDSLLVNARGTPLSSRQSPLGSFATSTSAAVGGRRSSNSASFAASSSRRTSDMSLRRESFGTPRSSPQAFNELDGFGQATKSSRASVGLNSKWLYDKGKDSPTSAAFLGSGWGTGSVFN